MVHTPLLDPPPPGGPRSPMKLLWRNIGRSTLTTMMRIATLMVVAMEINLLLSNTLEAAESRKDAKSCKYVHSYKLQ